MIKNLPEDILFEGVTYPKGTTEIPDTLEEFVDQLNAMLNPELKEQEPKVTRSRSK